MPISLPPSGSIAPPDLGWEIQNPRRLSARGAKFSLVLAIIFAILLLKLYAWQILNGAHFLAQAKQQRVQRVSLGAPRGLITDRHGARLATSRIAHAISLVPALLPHKKRQSAARLQKLENLGELLGLSAGEIENRLTEGRKNGARLYDPIPIASDVDLATIARVEENRSRLGSAVLVTDEPRRFYPEGALAPHVLGYVQLASPRDLERARERKVELRFDDKVGKSGIERVYDDFLRGVPGAQLFEVDAQGQPIQSGQKIAEKPGATLALTLDLKLQRAAENALKSARNTGAIAAIDPRNGEVLALASNPSFDPNIFSLATDQFKTAYQKIAADPKHPLLHRAVVSRFPPGSTFKPATALAGLEKGVVDPYWSVNCPGFYKMGRRFGCWKAHGGGINLKKALAQSCDVYFYQLSLKLGDPESSGPDYLAQTARQLGLGSKTGLDLPSDEAGLIPDPAWRRRINPKNPDLARWYPGNTLNMSIGQGDVLATPLQMALATGAIANGGTLWQPHLLREAQAPNGEILRRKVEKGRNVGFQTRNLNLVRAGMREVVLRGTGKPCNLPQVAVAGKTGSAEDVHNVLPHSWWVCFAPYDKPRIAIAVIIENAGHGSENALPVAREVLEAAFPMPTATPKP